MAVLTGPQLDNVRHAFAEELRSDGIPWTRAKLNAAIQAIEDVFESGALQTAISNAINTATSPAVLTGAQKRALVKFWLRSRFDRGN